MPDMSVHVDDADARRELNIISAGLADLTGFWPMLVPLWLSWMRRQFETEGAFGGQPWPPLSPAYAVWKASRRPGKPVLQLTGAMKQAVSRPHRSQTPQSLTLTIDDKKLGYHQDGTTRMPARPVIFGDPLPPVAAMELERAADEYVTDLIRRARGGR